MASGTTTQISEKSGLLLDMDGEDEFPDAYATVPVLIHVGPYKTGTSWLQGRFFPHIQNAVLSKDFRTSQTSFLLPRFGEFSPSQARAPYMDLLRQAHQNQSVLVLSNEALGGNAYGHRYVREVVASRLKLTFPHAKILVSAREQVATIVSLYSEYLRGGHSSDLTSFVSQGAKRRGFHPLLDLSFWDWSRTYQFYAKVFGEGNVLIAPMEWFMARNEQFVDAISQMLGHEIIVRQPIAFDAVERPSLSSVALYALMLLNRLHPPDTRYARKASRFSPNTIAHKIDSLTPRSVRARGKARQRAIVREAVGDSFATSNIAFSQRFGIDLSEFGYRT